MTRMGIFGAKGKLNHPLKSKPKPQRKTGKGSGGSSLSGRSQSGSWLGRLWDALRSLLGSGQTRGYARANKALQKQSKANIQRADQLQKKVGRVRERK